MRCSSSGRKFRIIANEPTAVGEIQGHLLYLQQSLDDDRQLVNGWLILPNSPRSFVILTILTGFVPGLFLYLIMTFIVPVESEGQGRPD